MREKTAIEDIGRFYPLTALIMLVLGSILGGLATPAEAAAMGLANQCVVDSELEAVVGAMAADIVANSWHSARGNKMLYNRGQDYTFHDGLAFEMAESPGRSADTEERVKAFSKG